MELACEQGTDEQHDSKHHDVNQDMQGRSTEVHDVKRPSQDPCQLACETEHREAA